VPGERADHWVGGDTFESALKGAPMVQRHLDVAVFSVDPPALDMFHGLDPESYLIVSAIADGLLFVDEAGTIRPSLATAWEQISPVTFRFKLREGVQFHDGAEFDADDVIATFTEHFLPDRHTVLARSAFSVIASFRKLGRFEIELSTVAPDSMFLRRLCFSQIYPKRSIERGGREAVRAHPIGTGAFRLERWDHGTEIVLRRNDRHWAARGAIETIRIPILRQKNWVSALKRGLVDVALGIDVHDKVRLEGEPELATFSADSAISHFFLWKHQGPLANLRVRQALNHAVHRQLIVEIAEHGFGRAQQSVATPETFGYTPDVRPYVYNPELAKRVLAEEGYPNGFRLRGLVSETSTAVYYTVKEFLRRVQVELDAEIVPRAEWMARVRGPKLRGEGDYEGDFALFVLDNPLLHSIFHQFVFLFTVGDWTLVHDERYDAEFLRAATTVGEGAEAALQRLEHHAVDNAMILFTAQAAVHAAARRGISFPLPKSGHFDTPFWWGLDSTAAPRDLVPIDAIVNGDAQPAFAPLVQATEHLGTLYLAPGAEFTSSDAQNVWHNLEATQKRWETQLAPMVRELVSQVETKTHLANVLDSTERIALAGIGDDGRQLFVNEGYRRMIGGERPIHEQLSELWPEIVGRVNREGSWSAPVRLKRSGGENELYLTVTRARDLQRLPIGYTLVFSDFSGAEERIRNEAIRAILDNVQYGLFRCSRDGVVLPGYSAACHELFPEARAIEGRHFVDLLGVSPRDAENLSGLFRQLVDDVLPEQVNVGQFPSHVESEGRVLALKPVPLRDADGNVNAVLFSMRDETTLVEAQRNQDYLRAVVNVLRHRDPFGAFVKSAAATSFELLTSYSAHSREWQSVARRFLHTCKGVVSQYGFSELGRALHRLEETEHLDVTSLGELRARLRGLLTENAELWKIDFEECVPEYQVRAADFELLESTLDRARNLDEARAAVRRWSELHQQKSVNELLGPIASSCLQHAERRGKSVRFTLAGGELVLPPRQWSIASAVTHLVRNAVDHGVEEPNGRGAKPASAEVRVEFSSEGDSMCCRVSDDGAGIDGRRLVAKACERGLISETQAAALTRDELFSLMFGDGVSSADSVTETAGRGVGMSAVKATLEALGGTVRVRSDSGRGTSVELRWPVREPARNPA
jgi:ABC-type transport system substrate-binding protein/signal transduction histidine kinase